MGEISLGKLHGLTHDDTIKAHHLFTATAKKTPYQLDLEVKDRKPDIVPKVGDKVKIKSRKWYEKWKNPLGRVYYSGTECIFSEDMDKCCGKEFTVIKINDTPYGRRWILELVPHSFILEMFEEVYPQESSKEEKCTKAFEAFKISSDALEKSLVASSAIPAINPVQGIGISYDLGTLSRQGAGLEVWPNTSPRTNLPQSCFGRMSAVIHQDFLKDKEPELQTIKKHRFIKLENL